MESIGVLLKPLIRPVVKPNRENKHWLLACECATLTNTKPIRWLREVKYFENVIRRALATTRELHPRNPAAYFTKLVQIYKQETS